MHQPNHDGFSLSGSDGSNGGGWQRPPHRLQQQRQQQQQQQQQQQGASGGISLNVHLAVPQPGPLSASSNQEGGHTPNTPEILNSIVNMQSGPFAAYATTTSNSTSNEAPALMNLGSSDEGPSYIGLVHHHHHPESSPSPSSSSPASTPSATMSVQHYRSQFIKEGLKLKVRQKLVEGGGGGGGGRIRSCSDPPDFLLESPMTDMSCSSVRSNSSSSPGPDLAGMIKQEELTEEDEVRRMRRRERNKVAATKCRNKKKHRTQLLMKESDHADAQNHSLKSEIAKLEIEKRRLMEILSVHEPNCAKRMRLQESSFRIPAVPPPLQQSQSSSSSSRTPAVLPPSRLPSTTRSLSSSVQSNNRSTHQNNMYPGVDVKPQIQLNSFPISPGLDDLGGDDNEDEEEEEEEAFLQTSCSSSFDEVINSSATGFLAKRRLGHGYLELDSRCIAL